MNMRLRISILIGLVLMAGCSSSIEIATTATQIEGVWFVGVHEANGQVRQIGSLHISGNTYNYQPISEGEAPQWISERLTFINTQAGNVLYEANSQVNEPVQEVKDHAILGQLSFEEVFFVRVDQLKKQLYLHSQVSEFQQYEIRKGYGD